MSLPSWECGLKYHLPFPYNDLPNVAPLVGVRIEIYKIIASTIITIVAPLVGVRIEIMIFSAPTSASIVAPLVGVRIEIQLRLQSCYGLHRRSPRGSAD